MIGLSEANSAHDIYGSYAEAVEWLEARWRLKRMVLYEECVGWTSNMPNPDYNAIAVRNHVDSYMLQWELLGHKYYYERGWRKMMEGVIA